MYAKVLVHIYLPSVLKELEQGEVSDLQVVKRGKAAPNRDLKTELAARTDAAYIT
jgi:hypothetical protein